MIIYTWNIEKLQVANDGLVVKAYWLLVAKDEKNSLTAAASGIRTLVRGNNFTAYSQLTEQQVLDWCFEPEVITWTTVNRDKKTITKHLKDDGEKQVTGQIERQLTQKAAEPALPWL